MKPRSLMFTLYGEYIKHYGGEVWVGSLIQLMGKFGVSESSVRGAIFRMVQKNLLQVRKIGNKSYYSVTELGRRRIEDGVKRVYTTQSQAWDGMWRILTYSFPEEKRELRNIIRKELNWTGFGVISNSTWVSPNPLEEQVLEMIDTYKIHDHTFLMSAGSIVSHDNESIIKKGWDLEKISSEYDGFIENLTPKFEELREKALNNLLTDDECFIERTKLVHEYRKFLFQDPGFPRDLLPNNWSGSKARDLFWQTHQLISIPAVRCFEQLFESPPDIDVEKNRNRAINPFREITVPF
ncbi:PaaX family transcrtiptional regulator [Alkalihalobacillus alcalophilus ATCC 27647 = CGMCC 1.3604]|uniref:PaaX family transcrtiptional regulator n=1 Tax=Alkalihalobacillus alcalophilus ATCC 27647 = CGMCC 1.3604 TaxID=1218173 RepID=A0A094WFW2_ALKAL|nr:PaaX family transcriptional regulator C-terminal domain-containing protein [Alkalihalobacillus alcalophilus]KGA95666.1 PaaX family transcrtiptional regulator [Alkalihalobacillus alcalophilus ATCC 27647 = CGMCC 1.3604]MED1563747.1 PaaX family transcriptional regulator C-terminal domain-containing protein [Alkalihalobacillus alcalophilus]THG92278.1 PaaX family transcrtiptional regulator [Alkalihalobacillus alcalophilus ATCC 27647 = CGMCC 1.3604]